MNIQQYTDKIADLDCLGYEGRITRVTGSIIESLGPAVGVGQLCHIFSGRGDSEQALRAEVIGFRDSVTVLMPLDNVSGIQAGDKVISSPGRLEVGLGDKLLGRTLDGLGRPIDNAGPLPCPNRAAIYNQSPHPLRRKRICDKLLTGIRAIDIPLTLGKGQRIGIFAGSGVGKSTLLGQIARNCEADVNVIALTGERGREVGQFLEDCLGEKGLKKSVVVVAPADAPPLLKVKAAFTSTTIAEYYRDKGLDVLYMMDSLTRVANSQREIGLAAGEPPTSRGYPPSVFSLIPTLTERLGNAENGSITGIYTILVERDDMTEPVADAVRASLDGHVVLSRELADKGRYPAIDILGSISRTIREIASPEHIDAVGKLKAALSVYQDAADLINIGAYTRGTSPAIDVSIDIMPELEKYLRQEMGGFEPFDESLSRLENIVAPWIF